MHAVTENSATTIMRCMYDSGSATDCRPLCSGTAIYEIRHWVVGKQIASRVCNAHVRCAEARIYPAHFETVRLQLP